MHVWKDQFFEIRIASCEFMQYIYFFVFTVLTKLIVSIQLIFAGMGFFRFLTEIRFFLGHLGHSWDWCRSGLIFLGGGGSCDSSTNIWFNCLTVNPSVIWFLSVTGNCYQHWTLPCVMTHSHRHLVVSLSPTVYTRASIMCSYRLAWPSIFTLLWQNELSVGYYNSIYYLFWRTPVKLSVGEGVGSVCVCVWIQSWKLIYLLETRE